MDFFGFLGLTVTAVKGKVNKSYLKRYLHEHEFLLFSSPLKVNVRGIHFNQE